MNERRRLKGVTRVLLGEPGGGRLGIGTRGRGSESTAAPVWGLSAEDYLQRCDPWPLNPKGELLLGVKLESPEGIANCEQILAVDWALRSWAPAISVSHWVI